MARGHRAARTLAALVAAIALGHSSPVRAQLTDVTQTPDDTIGAKPTIGKSLEEQIGAGRGDVNTPGSSAFIIARDPARSIRRGRQIFQRKFTLMQGVGPRTGDGVGDIRVRGSVGAGLADSCAACHGRPRGSAGFGGQVFTRPDSRDAPHLFGLGLQEMLADRREPARHGRFPAAPTDRLRSRLSLTPSRPTGLALPMSGREVARPD